ncbi:hypothetical protein [Myxococcus sp. RHSTA-1-4]|uniref:hypothetical protein n=1 Tax=Myxococcus sp. RHSTA-1-4 TaxID=2874601 RepID=UPI001CBEA325|nr:hypothetical protein [Myxococcus sp. RHSTA-1-4]MBZ4420408.1 hypothetical protein [Myxococcus sp. RHSTA-1-4]
MNNARVQQGMKERLERMKTLRDEIRLDLHLAGMDLKDRWRELEPKVLEAERRAEEVGVRVLDELVERLLAVRETMHERKEVDRHPPA